MPRFDGRGPRGMGPQTGRGFGPCMFGLGRAGRGFSRFFNPFQGLNKEERKNTLSEYRKALEEELEDIKKEEEKLA